MTASTVTAASLFNLEAKQSPLDVDHAKYLASNAPLWFRTPLVCVEDLLEFRESLLAIVRDMPPFPALKLYEEAGARGVADGIHYFMLRRYVYRNGARNGWRVPYSADKMLHFFVHSFQLKNYLEGWIGEVNHCTFWGALPIDEVSQVKVLSELCWEVFGKDAYDVFSDPGSICYDPDVSAIVK